ncbi:MAG: TIGR02597 family protein [Verrucomicrobia bacterium]|nr:TIGR02597 family protein [Verrucomicrobiota bacterium]
MNTPRRFLILSILGAAAFAAIFGAFPGIARSQTTSTAATDPVGFLSIALPANSDTFVSIPFTRPVEFTGSVGSVTTTGTAPNTVGTITFSGTPGLTQGAFAPLSSTAPNDGHKSYYAIIGPKNVALTSTLAVANNSTSVTASTAWPGDLAVGDTVTITGSANGATTPAVNYTFTVAALPTTTTLTLDRAYPGNTDSALAATYNHSPSEGRFYTVTTNDSGSLTLSLNGDSLDNVTTGTQVSVIPYWTFGTVFPATDVNVSFLASTGPQFHNRGTRFLIPDLSAVGIRLPPTLIYYFYNGYWRLENDPVTTNIHEDDALLPNTYFIARNVSSPSVAASPLTLTSTGTVLMNRISTPLQAQSNTRQDNSVAIPRPAAVTLNDLGLITSPNAFVASTGTTWKTRGDQLLVFDNSSIKIDKGESATYYYYNNAWRQDGDPTGSDVGATAIIQPATGIKIRKAAVNGTAPATPFWQNARNYLN